jgi:hypothetical protein
VIAQGDPVRVPGQVPQYLLGPPKGLLDVTDKSPE